MAILLGAAALALMPAAAGAARCSDCDTVGSGGGSGSGTGSPGGVPYSEPTLAMYRVDWPAFTSTALSCAIVDGQNLCQSEDDKPMADGDVILLREQADATIPSTKVEVVLQSKVTWWKEIKAFNGSGEPLASVETQDAQSGPVTMRLDLATAKWLVFSKAKFLGIHTGVYQLGSLSAKGGKRLTFTWSADH